MGIHRKKKHPDKPDFTWSELRGLILVAMGVATLVFYYSWWFKLGRIFSPILFITFVVALAYGLFQIVGNWLIYLAAHRRFFRPAWRQRANDYTVDVLLTAYDEEFELIERALVACLNMEGRQKVWLLDDGRNPRLKALAERLGSGYLVRDDNKDAKAGNLNAALARTDSEIIVIFDIDHAPNPDFLQRTLGYFTNPNMGFVQVMLTFENQQEGWVAEAAAESSLDFYNPTSIGSDGLWSATLIGSNAVIRRTALESIGGYHPGLAEDLATSIALHAAGWESIYVEEPLAPGLAPPDMLAWFKQQFKWARGVFELFVTRYFQLLPRLNRGKIVAYGVRMTYYWVGLFAGMHILATIWVMLFGGDSGMYALQDYLLHLAPLGVMVLLIRQLALRRWKHVSLESRVQWRPMFLVISTWPIYTLAWMMAVLRIPLGFQPTPKSKSNDLPLGWLLPQIATTILLIVGLIVAIAKTGFNYPIALAFGFGLALPHCLMFLQALLVSYKPLGTKALVKSGTAASDS